MTTNCKQCGKSIESNAPFCTYCGAANDLGGGISASVVKCKKKHNSLFILLYILGAFAAIVALIAVLNANMLLPWQWGARRNKQVILEYAKEHYPNAEIVGQEFNSARFFVWNNLLDRIVFTVDNFEFTVTAEGGSVVWDGYPKARACAQFDKIIQDGFFKVQGIQENAHYSFKDNYKEIYPYTGSLSIYIQVNDQGSTAREVGWLYDFYGFWKVEGTFLKDYRVDIDIYEDKKEKSHITFYTDSEFANEGEFYSAFKTNSYWYP